MVVRLSPVLKVMTTPRVAARSEEAKACAAVCGLGMVARNRVCEVVDSIQNFVVFSVEALMGWILEKGAKEV